MILVFGVVILLISTILSAKSLFHRGHTKLKIILGICYVLLLAEAINVYYSASVADDRGVSGTAVNWFGTWWMVIAFIIVAIIVAIQIWISRSAKS